MNLYERSVARFPAHVGSLLNLGILYEDPAPTFESAVIEQNAAAAAGKTPDLQKLVSQGQTWQV